jgi:hypothetical protein
MTQGCVNVRINLTVTTVAIYDRKHSLPRDTSLIRGQSYNQSMHDSHQSLYFGGRFYTTVQGTFLLTF